jgi:hypothetical protein
MGTTKYSPNILPPQEKVREQIKVKKQAREQ